MVFNADAVRVGNTGKILVAPKGTTAPVDLVSAWPAGWADLGYMSDDGVEMNPSTSTDDIKAWQSLSPIRKILTEFALTLQFTALEFKTDVVKLYFPSATISTSGGVSTLSIKAAPDPDERAFGFEWQDGVILNRIVFPRGEVTDRGSLKAARSAAVGLQMTVSAYATSAPDMATWLSNDPNWA
jgi:hypothetical protein